MTEQEWLTSTDPAAMLRYLQGEPLVFTRIPQPSDRKLRLFGVALADAYHEGESDLTDAYLFVDGVDEPPPTPPIRWELYDVAPSVFASDAIQNFTVAGIRPVRMQTPGVIKAYRKRLSLETALTILRDIFGNPFRPATLSRMLPHNETMAFACGGIQECGWLTETVLNIAQSIYDERAFERMPILADALEEAGCREEAVLRHLRGEEPCENYGREPLIGGSQCSVRLLQHMGLEECPKCGGSGWRPLRSPHVRGCWVLDLILGKG